MGREEAGFGGRGGGRDSGMSENHEVRDLIPGYALGCLDPEDETTVRAHLEACESCRRELAAFREVSDLLALSVPSVEPPPGLGERILRRLPPGKRRPRPRFLRPVLAAAAAVLAAALVLGNVLQATGVIGKREPQTPPGVISIALIGTADAREAYGSIVLDSDQNRGVLAVRGLPPLDPGHQYQLWLLRDGRRANGGVFSVDSGGYAALMVDVPADFAAFQSLGVSVEPAGGSPAPTGTRVMSGKR
jgi:anti-sigma-K factor RskA